MITNDSGAQRQSGNGQPMSRRGEEKRENARIKHGEAARLYNVDKIGARIVTDQQNYDGTLLDLSAGGAAIITVSALPINLPVNVELQVGDHCIKAAGLVKNRNKLGGKYRLGVQFTYLDPEEQDFLLLLDGPGGTHEEQDGLSEK